MSSQDSACADRDAGCPKELRPEKQCPKRFCPERQHRHSNADVDCAAATFTNSESPPAPLHSNQSPVSIIETLASESVLSSQCSDNDEPAANNKSADDDNSGTLIVEREDLDLSIDEQGSISFSLTHSWDQVTAHRAASSKIKKHGSRERARKRSARARQRTGHSSESRPHYRVARRNTQHHTRDHKEDTAQSADGRGLSKTRRASRAPADASTLDQLPAQQTCHWEPHNRPHAHPQIFFRGVGYCSLSEAAFAQLLEYFIPGFDIVPGGTFQVPIGGGRSVDFCINGTLVEYHQLRLTPSRGKFGDFSSEGEFREYKRILQRVKGNSRKRALLDSIVRQRLASHYYRKRRAIIDTSPHFRHCDLVVATTREEFFEHVLRRFSILEVPSSQVLERMFWQAVKQVARAQAARQAL